MKTIVAVLFERLGPYHIARLQGLRGGMELVAVELFARDETYDWETIEGKGEIRQHTLFATRDDLRTGKTSIIAKVGSVLETLNPSVVAVPGWGSPFALAALNWCNQRGTPAIVMSESTEWDEPRKPWKEWIKRKLIARCSAVLVGGSPHHAYLKKLGMPEDRIFLGYDAVDNGYFAARAAETRKLKLEPSGARSPALGCPEWMCGGAEQNRKRVELPEKYLLASARFVEKKNLPRLLQAYARYRELVTSSTIHGSPITSHAAHPWSLVLLGDGELRPALEAQLLALHEKEESERSRQTRFSTSSLLESVHLPGFIQYPELPTYYGLASAFIHASTTEQWGLVVNEAMASGLPVLVSNRCGCAPDLVKEGVNGFTFDPTNVEELAGLMLRISALDFPLSDFGAASQKIIADWGPERFDDGLNNAVKAALAAPSPKVGWLDRLLLRILLLR